MGVKPLVYSFEGADGSYHHTHMIVQGEIRETGGIGHSPYRHDGHYGTRIFGGAGAWMCADGKRRIFRGPDHARRLVRNMMALGLPRETIPTAEQVLTAMVKIASLNAAELTQAQDVYLRIFGGAWGEELGVHATGTADWQIITRDLTEYLKLPEGEFGINLLFPGRLFRRASPYNGYPHIKSAANYPLGAKFKGVVAKWYGCNEVLGMTHEGDDLAETTGSNLFFVFQDENTVVTPDLHSWCLPGLTRATMIKIFEHMGVTVAEKPVSRHELVEAEGFSVSGSWSGFVPVQAVMRATNENPPLGVFHDGEGDAYLEWLERSLNPKPIDAPFARRGEPHPLLAKAAESYWAMVRRDMPTVERLLPGFEIPAEWHTDVPDPSEI